MDDDARILGAFLEADEEVRRSLIGTFEQVGTTVFDESTKRALSYIARKIGLSQRDMETIQYDRRRIIEKLMDNYMNGAVRFSEEFDGTRSTAEEITHGTFSVDEETYENAQMYCRRMRGKISELDDPNNSKRMSNSSFSRVAMRDVDFLREYIGNNFGGNASRNFEYYCEAELYNHFTESVALANHVTSKATMSGIDAMQACTRQMNKSASGEKTNLRVSSIL